MVFLPTFAQFKPFKLIVMRYSTFILIGFALFLQTGCNQSGSNQNAVQSPAPSAQTAPAPNKVVEEAPTKIDKTLLDKHKAKAQENLKGLKNLLKQLDALPASVKQNNATQVENLRENLSGMITKMQFVIDDLSKVTKIADEPSAGGDSEGSNALVGGAARRLKDYTSDLDRYAEDVKNYGDAIKQLK
jgi:hypothetical protein